MPARRPWATVVAMSTEYKEETFAQRLERLEQARAKARLAGQALDQAAGKKLPRKPRRAAGAGAKGKTKGTALRRKPAPARAGPGAWLDTPEAIAAYLTEALISKNAGYVAGAIGFVARARGMAQLARTTGLSRESLYRALKLSGNPEFSTILKICAALGLRLTVEPVE